ncbi:hypothetical protein SESBI_16231 [Sesbania bispinosa]|nr:hypothetical protein SESBI_16231 [Sesbania bispinosa]
MFSHVSARCGFRDDLWRCKLTKLGLVIKVFQDLHTHFARTRSFTGSRDKISSISSSERTGIRCGGSLC